MPASILQQKTLGNQLIWYLAGLDFSSRGVQFRITGTESTGPGPYDTLHTIKNIEKGTYAQVEMKKLIQILLTIE